MLYLPPLYFPKSMIRNAGGLGGVAMAVWASVTLSHLIL